MILIGGLGAMDGISVAMRQSIVQLTTPDQMRGRAVALQVLAAQTANNLGTLEVGFLTAAAGLSFTLTFGGAAALVFTLGAWRLVPGIRNYRFP
jgi:predicted MFS family arabinose efflux permease